MRAGNILERFRFIHTFLPVFIQWNFKTLICEGLPQVGYTPIKHVEPLFSVFGIPGGETFYLH